MMMIIGKIAKQSNVSVQARAIKHVKDVSIAARDTRGFIKLLRKTGTDELIGARLVAPEG